MPPISPQPRSVVVDNVLAYGVRSAAVIDVMLRSEAMRVQNAPVCPLEVKVLTYFIRTKEETLANVTAATGRAMQMKSKTVQLHCVTKRRERYMGAIVWRVGVCTGHARYNQIDLNTSTHRENTHFPLSNVVACLCGANPPPKMSIVPPLQWLNFIRIIR
jgi:hypothetical protein